MVSTLVKKIFGDPNARKLKKILPLVDEINDLEASFQALSDDDLKAKTQAFRKILAERPQSEDLKQDFKLEQETLELLLPEAFATVREAAKRVLGMRHYDVQLIGGIVLHRGGIAEMRTGEGKTLVATLPAYLNALTGKGVHVVTVNDYLARRDAEWMGRIYRFLGLSVGVVLSDGLASFDSSLKRNAYQCDITYGTNNEFGFDYLRDNMATSVDALVQRPFNYAIIDEVDSILIDEARTPLIISGRVEQSPETYETFAKLSPMFEREAHYTVDEKAKNIILTEEGVEHAERLLGLDDLFHEETNFAHLLVQAIRARELYKRDIDYVVTPNGQIAIVDEFTGRLMEGRRWSDGLHQSIEAKERVQIQDETQTLASITFQNLFRLYPKLSGMTGTAMTEEAEFSKIYNLEVISIPTNQVDKRQNQPDLIYKNERVKFFKVVESIVAAYHEGRPVLVGTTSIEKSEYVSLLLTDARHLREHLDEKIQRLRHQAEKRHLDQASSDKLNAVLGNALKHTPEDFEALADGLQKTVLADMHEMITDLGKTVQAIHAIDEGVPHHVLNAKYHEQEAAIVAQAGRLKAVTIATNMAGRGTDILLGGNPDFLARQHFENEGRLWQDVPEDEFAQTLAHYKAITDQEKEQVIALGGLLIIGTERHESRRIDNQLRGRAARQGDPGGTQFYLSLEDGFLKIFQGKMIANLMDMLDVEETQAISAGLVTRAIEGAQRKVEAYHFELRKNVLRYDDILTTQRQLIYTQRRQVLFSTNLREDIRLMVHQTIDRLVRRTLSDPRRLNTRISDPEMLEAILADYSEIFPIHRPGVSDDSQMEYADSLRADALLDMTAGQVIDRLIQHAETLQEQLEASLRAIAQELETRHGIQIGGGESSDEDSLMSPLRELERSLLLQIIDQHWIEYLHKLDSLRDGIGLRAYGQKDPLIEYKREAYEMFQQLSFDIQDKYLSQLFNGQLQINISVPEDMFPDMPSEDFLDEDAPFTNTDEPLPEAAPPQTL